MYHLRAGFGKCAQEVFLCYAADAPGRSPKARFFVPGAASASPGRRRPKGSGSVYQLTGHWARPWAAVTGTGKLLGTFATSGEAVAALDA